MSHSRTTTHRQTSITQFAPEPETVGEVGYWTASYARGRSIAARALDVLCDWAFHQYGSARLTRLELVHQVDNHASCRVATKARFALVQILAPRPPWPLEGHLHVRRRNDDAMTLHEDHES